MSISATISGVAVSVGNASFNIQDPLENRAVLTFTVLDAAGTDVYSRGQPVTFSDPGILSYTGYVQSDQPTKDGLALPYVEHVITCMDGVYNFDKRSNSQNYLNWQAGNIAVDFVRRDLSNEGITIAAAIHRDTTDVDFNQGTLNGLVGALHTPGDGDLELPSAGSTVTISEVTQVTFQTGTLTNVSAPSAGGLTPTLTPTFQLIGTGSGTIYVAFWAGSQVIGTSDTLVYSTFNDAVAGAGSISFICSDGSNYQQNVGTDTTTNPGTGWWARTITLPSYWNGKTITQVQAVMTSSSGASCNAYFQNVHLGSVPGSPFFSATLNTTPYATVLSGYTNCTTQVVNTNVLGITTMRQSPSYSLASAGILKSAYLSYASTQPANTAITIKISSDGGATWYTCTNNALIPTACLVPGMNLSGISLLVQETFTNTGTDPTVYATLSSLTITIQPAAAATKTDVSYIVDTQAGWQAGTLTNVVAQSDGTLTIPSSQVFGTNTEFDNGNNTGYTWLVGPSTIATSSTTANGVSITMLESSVTHSHVQISGPGTYTTMTLYMDVFHDYSSSVNNIIMGGPTYLNPQWNNTAGTFGYCAMMTTTTVSGNEAVWVSLVRGSAGGSTTTIAGPVQLTGGMISTFQGVTLGSTLKVVYSGGSHTIYANNIFVLSATDSTFTTAANVGMYAISSGTGPLNQDGHARFFNFGITPIPASSGTFVSSATSLTPVGTYGTSLVDWSVLTPSVLQNPKVEASIDGGTTYTACTNGQPIPGITAGTSMSGKSLVMRVTLLSAVLSNIETINGLRVLVMGQYNATGTRSTAPMGNDTFVRANQSNWGTAFDGQAWALTGTATAAITSNEGTLANTTGDAHERLGTSVWTDEEATVRFQLSATTISAGPELRYSNSSNYYRLAASTTALSIVKNTGSGNTTLATATVSLSTGTWYRLRFRCVGAGPVVLQGKVWLDGTLEPGIVEGVLSTTSPQWTVTASD